MLGENHDVYVLTVQPGDLRVTVRSGETIDEALTREGWDRPWGGCRAGGCGACSARLVETPEQSLSDVQFASPRGDIRLSDGRRNVLVCVAVPASHLTVTFRNGQVRPRPAP